MSRSVRLPIDRLILVLLILVFASLIRRCFFQPRRALDVACRDGLHRATGGVCASSPAIRCIAFAQRGSCNGFDGAHIGRQRRMAAAGLGGAMLWADFLLPELRHVCPAGAGEAARCLCRGATPAPHRGLVVVYAYFQ